MVLFIHGRRLVAEAERDFSCMYPFLKLQFLQYPINGNGPVQNARATQRLNEIWHLKSDTQGWTLKQQNEHGRELSEDKLLPGNVKEDYDLHRDPD